MESLQEDRHTAALGAQHISAGGRGLTSGAVAGRLFIWPHTVSTRLRDVSAKVGVPGRVALAAVVDHLIE